MKLNFKLATGLIQKHAMIIEGELPVMEKLSYFLGFRRYHNYDIEITEPPYSKCDGKGFYWELDNKGLYTARVETINYESFLTITCHKSKNKDFRGLISIIRKRFDGLYIKDLIDINNVLICGHDIFSSDNPNKEMGSFFYYSGADYEGHYIMRCFDDDEIKKLYETFPAEEEGYLHAITYNFVDFVEMYNDIVHQQKYFGIESYLNLVADQKRKYPNIEIPF